MYRIIIIALIFCLLIYYFKQQKIEITYFYSEGCELVKETNLIVDKIEHEFKDRVIVKKINAFSPKDDEERKIVEKFNVKGVPTILINGREYHDPFNYTEMEKNICKQFLIKPKTCQKIYLTNNKI
ncbi:MAG: thioredoxin family protein [Candidatus Aenigmatarchaeota archaeon]